MTVGHVSRTHSILPFETAGMKKKTKKKMKVDHFEKKISKRSDLKFFLQIGSEKKKFEAMQQSYDSWSGGSN